MTKESIEVSTAKQIGKLVASYDNFLFDCDGVIWLDEKLVPGVKETLSLLKSEGKESIFITNNSSQSRLDYESKFKRLGIDGIDIDRIYPTCYAAALYLQEKLKIPTASKIWVLGDKGIEDELKLFGYRPVGGTDQKLNSTFHPEHELLVVDPDVKAVVVGSTKDLNYMRIASTLQYLLYNERSIPFIGCNIDKTYPGPQGMILPAGGSVVNYMEYTSSRKSINVGKPSPVLLDTILSHQKYDRGRTIMIGDTLYTDIKFGNDGKLGNGMGSLLVLTGGSSLTDLNEISRSAQLDKKLKSFVPSYYMKSLGDFYNLLEENES